MKRLPDPVHAAIDARLDDYRDALFDLLRHPTISSTGEDMSEGANLTARFLAQHGFEEVTIVETGHDPLVYAELRSEADAPTVVFYGHYDVQPPGDEDDWDSPPFEPTIRDGSIYARAVPATTRDSSVPMSSRSMRSWLRMPSPP